MLRVSPLCGNSWMRSFSLNPDKDMEWIYDYTHPDYHTPRAKDLRARRDHALRQCPQWMLEEASLNDALEADKEREKRFLDEY